MRIFAVRTRSGSSVRDDVPPKKSARTSTRRFVIGLPPRKCACTSRVSATSSIPVRKKTISRSSFTFTPSSLRNPSSLGVLAEGSRRSSIRPCLSQKSRNNFISRSDKSYCGPTIRIVFSSDGIASRLKRFSSWNLMFSFSMKVFKIEIALFSENGGSL